MLRGILILTLSLCLGAAAAPAALAQAAPPINEQEAHAIAVDAMFTLPHHVDGRVPEAIHQRHNRFQGSDEHVRQRARVSTG